jgi:hypothetical protein
MLANGEERIVKVGLKDFQKSEYDQYYKNQEEILKLGEKKRQTGRQEERDNINETLKELYPSNFILMPDYILSVWNTHIFKNFYNADYIYEMPSETCDDTPLESFQKTDCYSVHGYKTLYGKPFTEEMKAIINQYIIIE